jgi:predicted dehydrogenase
MSPTSRRTFLRKAAITAGAPAIRAAWAQRSPNEVVNIAVVGFHGRGKDHYRAFAKMPNVRVAVLCDADERLFPAAVAEVEKLAGYRPATEFDIRRLLERKDIDAVSIATPDYWHALMTVWACQAGKDVYVEKPVSFTIVEGRRMVEAARKYKRIVQAGLDLRSESQARAAMRVLQEGKLGQVYRGKVIITKPRGSIGRMQESSIPEGVHWDLFLGPTRYFPYTANHLHYGWHFFWETSTTDIGNTGVHHLDVARWGMSKHVHPVKVHCTGGYYVWNSEQDTPNFQVASFEYADRSIIDLELSNLYAPPSPVFNLFYTSEGYMSCGQDWKAMKGVFEPRGPESSPTEHATVVSAPRATYVPGPPVDSASEKSVSHFENFISCVRSRKVEDLYCDILEGHMSTSLAHLANISFRTGRKLIFDPDKEKFVGDDEANRYLTREYRKPYTMPDKV